MGNPLQALPLTRKLNPFASGNLKGLAEAFILTRAGVGLVRIITDMPAFNPTDAPKKEKARNLLERIFIESIGTLGGFVALQFGMDCWSAVSGKGLNPQKWLERVEQNKNLTLQEKNKIIEAFKQTFRMTEDASKSGRHLITEHLLNKAGLNHFVEKLNNSALLSISETGHLKAGASAGATFLKNHSQQLFSTLNHRGVTTTLFGIVFSAVMSGAPVQRFNDSVVRKHFGPWFLDKLYGTGDKTASRGVQQPQPVHKAARELSFSATGTSGALHHVSVAQPAFAFNPTQPTQSSKPDSVYKKTTAQPSYYPSAGSLLWR
jgi:hypothetical protein